MREAARTAGQIASGGAAPGPVSIRPVVLPDFYPIERSSLRAPRPGQGRAAQARRQGGARLRCPHRPGRGLDVRGVARGAGGHLRRALRPRPAADDPLRRARGGRGGRQAPGRPLGRRRPAGHGAVPAARPEPGGARARGGPAGGGHAARRRGAGRSDAGGAGPGRLRHPAARGGGARAGGRLQPQEDLELHRPARQVGGQRAVHRGRRRHPGQRPRLDQRRRRGQPGPRERPDRERDPGGLHAGPHLGPALQAAIRPATAGARASGTSRCRA